MESVEGNGLPKKDVGKIALAMTPAAPDRLYALIETVMVFHTTEKKQNPVSCGVQIITVRHLNS